jgi:hypothetical protein
MALAGFGALIAMLITESISVRFQRGIAGEWNESLRMEQSRLRAKD